MLKAAESVGIGPVGGKIRFYRDETKWRDPETGIMVEMFIDSYDTGYLTLHLSTNGLRGWEGAKLKTVYQHMARLRQRTLNVDGFSGLDKHAAGLADLENPYAPPTAMLREEKDKSISGAGNGIDFGVQTRTGV